MEGEGLDAGSVRASCFPYSQSPRNFSDFHGYAPQGNGSLAQKKENVQKAVYLSIPTKYTLVPLS